jgi:hypothetical protein
VNARFNRRAKVVGIFPTALPPASLPEEHDESQHGRFHFPNSHGPAGPRQPRPPHHPSY